MNLLDWLLESRVGRELAIDDCEVLERPYLHLSSLVGTA